jgi:hypothetical protein
MFPDQAQWPEGLWAWLSFVKEIAVLPGAILGVEKSDDAGFVVRLVSNAVADRCWMWRC